MPASPRAAPANGHDPVPRPMDDRGFIGAVADRMAGVADRSGELIHEVRDRASTLVGSAMNVLGVAYRRGGNSVETGFDCSGFTRYVFEQSIGRVLPHRADEQANAPELVKVDKAELKPGDLVFFDTLRRTFSHVGIYLGDGKFIHSPRTGESVRVEDMNLSYWARHFTGARRVPELADPLAAAAATSALEQAAGQAAPEPATGLPALPMAESAAGVSMARAAAGFVPLHEPLARPLTDR